MRKSVNIRSGWNLSDQIKFTQELLSDGEERQPFLALKAQEMCVLTERRSPCRYFNLWLNRYFDAVVQKLEPHGYDTLLRDIHQKKFPIIVVGRIKNQRRPLESYGCFGKLIMAIENYYHETTYRRYRVFRLKESD